MGRAYGSRAQMAFAFETTYGTAPTPKAYWKIPFASTTLGKDQPLLESELLGYGRDPIDPALDAITVDGNVVVPLDARFLGLWLKLLFGVPTTTGAGVPYSHEFKSGSYNLPSAALEKGLPEVPRFEMFSGVRGNQISWTMQRSGLVTGEVQCIAQKVTPAAASAAGDLEELPLLRFGSFQGAIKRNGTALGNVVSGQITYSNNLDRVETIRSDGAIDGADPTMAMLSGNIVVRFADTTLLDDATNGTPCALTFEYVTTGDELFRLEAHRVFLPVPRIPVEGPGGVQVTFNFQAALDSVAGSMVTATLVNDMADFNNVVV